MYIKPKILPILNPKPDPKRRVSLATLLSIIAGIYLSITTLGIMSDAIFYGLELSKTSRKKLKRSSAYSRPVSFDPLPWKKNQVLVLTNNIATTIVYWLLNLLKGSRQNIRIMKKNCNKNWKILGVNMNIARHWKIGWKIKIEMKVITMM